MAWEGLGLRDVPITALRNGFVIFEFDESADYAGGAVPAYTLPEDRKIPLEVTKAKRERDDLGYRRFIYMNAFLLALYSGFSTVQKTAKRVQEPLDPTNYFGVQRIADGWKTFMDHGRKINFPRERSHNIEVETLDHCLDILREFHTAIGPASLDILSLTYTACHQYSRHQFSSAHLIDVFTGVIDHILTEDRSAPHKQPHMAKPNQGTPYSFRDICMVSLFFICTFAGYTPFGLPSCDSLLSDPTSGR